MLTQRIWFDSPITILQSEASNAKEQQYVIESIRSELVSPRRIVLGFGGDKFGGGNNDYTVLNEKEMKDAWSIAKTLLLDFFRGDPNIQPINNEQYLQNNRAKFIELEFGENIPSVLVSAIFEAYDSKIVKNMKEIKKILIPASNEGIIYIVGKDNTYEVSLPDYQNSKLQTFIEDYNKGEFVKYHPLLFNVAKNTTLMPVTFNLPIPQVFVESEIDVKAEKELTARAESFFKNFDFVKTIRETSGAMVYLYGYGEKSVRISSRGRLEYNEEINNVTSGNVIESLDAAIQFTLEQGGFPEGMTLNEIRPLTNIKGYYFGFGYEIEGYPLVSTGNNMKHPLEIEVSGNKVKTYRRFIRKKMSLTPMSGKEPILSPPYIIESNIELLKQDYLKDLSDQEKEIEDLDVLENINNVQLVYFDSNEVSKIEMLVPSWRIQVNNRVYYFDSYSGKELIPSSRLN